MPSLCSLRKAEKIDMTVPPIMVKVGGSLFDLPDLGVRLRSWLSTLPTDHILLVPGGGSLAEAIRDLDQCHRLGEEVSHWLALRAMALNAHFLAALLPMAEIVGDIFAWPAVGLVNQLTILDAHDFCRLDEGRAGSLPHSWDVTSDSVAARAAVVVRARELILLKSHSVPQDTGWKAASQQGLVDRHFPHVTANGQLSIQVVNFRKWRP